MAIPRNLANIAPHVNASSTELVVNDGGANLDFRVEGDTNANLLVADAGAEKVGFGTNTFNTNGGVIQVSNGISFPATQSACSDANTLDDYEEGTWTTTFSGESNLTGTPSLSEATYTKVGRLVLLQGKVTGYSITSSNTEVGFVMTVPFNSFTNTSATMGTVFCSAGRTTGIVVDNTNSNSNQIYIMIKNTIVTATGSTTFDFNVVYASA